MIFCFFIKKEVDKGGKLEITLPSIYDNAHA